MPFFADVTEKLMRQNNRVRRRTKMYWVGSFTSVVCEVLRWEQFHFKKNIVAMFFDTLPFQCPCFPALFTDQHEYFSDTSMVSGIADLRLIIYLTSTDGIVKKD